MGLFGGHLGPERLLCPLRVVFYYVCSINALQYGDLIASSLINKRNKRKLQLRLEHPRTCALCIQYVILYHA
jgi:hypothetical protein